MARALWEGSLLTQWGLCEHNADVACGSPQGPGQFPGPRATRVESAGPAVWGLCTVFLRDKERGHWLRCPGSSGLTAAGAQVAHGCTVPWDLGAAMHLTPGTSCPARRSFLLLLLIIT